MIDIAEPEDFYRPKPPAGTITIRIPIKPPAPTPWWRAWTWRSPEEIEAARVHDEFKRQDRENRRIAIDRARAK